MIETRRLPSGDVISLDGLRAVFFHGRERVDLIYAKGIYLTIDNPNDVEAIRLAVGLEPLLVSLR